MAAALNALGTAADLPEPRVPFAFDETKTDFELFKEHCLTDTNVLLGDCWLDVPLFANYCVCLAAISHFCS